MVPSPKNGIRSNSPFTLQVSIRQGETLHEAADAAMQASSPIDDVRGSARYRKEMVRNLSLQALSTVWEKLQKESA